MRSSLQSHLVPIGLLAASALLSFGCAKLLGADFDKAFAPAGAGGAGGATVAVSAAATTTGSGGSGGAGGIEGTGGAGGGDLVASCPDQPDESSGFCTVHVYVRKSEPDAGPITYVLVDAMLSLESLPPANYELMPTSTFKLARTRSAANDTQVFSCTEKNGTHTLALNSPCDVSVHLGYMSSSPQVGYEPLEWLSTGDGITEGNRRALIATSDHAKFCLTTPPYGICESSTYSAPSL